MFVHLRLYTKWKWTVIEKGGLMCHHWSRGDHWSSRDDFEQKPPSKTNLVSYNELNQPPIDQILDWSTDRFSFLAGGKEVDVQRWTEGSDNRRRQLGCLWMKTMEERPKGVGRELPKVCYFLFFIFYFIH